MIKDILLTLLIIYNAATVCYFTNRVTTSERECRLKTIHAEEAMEASSSSANLWIHRKEMCFFYRGFIKGGMKTVDELYLLLNKEGRLEALIDFEIALNLIFSQLSESISKGMSYIKENAPSKGASSSWIYEGLHMCDDILMKSSIGSYFSTIKNADFDSDKMINNRQELAQLEEKLIAMEEIQTKFKDALENGNIAFVVNYLRNSTR